MATKNNRRTIITKKILKEALLELLATKSISKITIKEICDLSDMSRSTFYLHYQDQFALLEDIEKEVLEKTFENLNIASSEIQTLDSIVSFLSYVKSNSDTFGILLCQPENLHFQKLIMDQVSTFVRSSLPTFFDDKKDAVYFSFIMHGSLNVIVDWINSDYELPITDVADVKFHSCNNILNN